MPTREQMLITYFGKFYQFITTEVMPGKNHSDLDKLKEMSAVDLAHWFKLYLVPYKDEITNPEHFFALMELLLQRIDPTYVDIIRNASPEQIHRIMLYFECFVDILTAE